MTMDSSHKKREEQSMLDLLNMLSPVQTLKVGVIGTILVLCTLGFFVLLIGGRGTMSKDMNDKAAGMADTTGAAAAPAQPQQPASPTDFNAVDPKVDHIRGKQNAKITLIEYSDFECPYCNRFQATMNQIMEKYGNDIRWVYRHHPLDGLHPNARQAALASECAGEQGKFWELADYMFEEAAQKGRLNASEFALYAKNVGLNTTTFNTCLTSEKYASRISRDEVEVPRQGTPYSVLYGPNGQKIPLNGALPYADVESAIKSLLQ